MIRHLYKSLTNTTNLVGTLNEATRVIWLEKTLAKIPAGARILDAGAGEQQFKKFCNHLNYVAQDFAQYDGKGDSKGFQIGSWDQTKLDIISDITDIPEPDSAFDVIMCIEVFEHLPNPILALKEFSRLLRPGGQLIITAPFCSMTHFAPYHFSTGFNSYFYETHLQAYGFEIIELQRNGNFFEYLAQEIHYLPGIASKYANSFPRKWERLALKVVLNMLQNYSAQDKASEEVLCFGIHVVAVKNLNKVS
jgi:ubiquinone/menaquinone biosynthesis C-methylase UbiE